MAPLRDGERRRAGAVGHLGRHLQKAEHRLDVGEALLDLAIDEADEVQRDGELHQERVDQHEIADRLRPGHDGARRNHHAHRHAEREDHGLAEIQPGERGPGAHSRALVARHGAVEALRLAPLVAEIFDRLVVQQRVDRLRMGVRVGIVHLAADGDAPVAGAHREPHIGPHRHRDDAHVPDVELVPDDAGGQRELQDGRQAVQDGEADDLLDAGRAALDDAREPAGAPLEMKAQRQLVQVDEGAVGELADRVLPDAREERVAQLVQRGGDDAPDIVGEHQHHRPGNERRHVGGRPALAGQRIGRPFEEIGHEHGDDLGGDERQEGDQHAPLQVRPVGRPHIGPEVPERRERAAAIRRDPWRRCRRGHQPAPRAPSEPAAAPTSIAIASRSALKAAKAAGLST